MPNGTQGLSDLGGVSPWPGSPHRPQHDEQSRCPLHAASAVSASAVSASTQQRGLVPRGPSFGIKGPRGPGGAMALPLAVAQRGPMGRALGPGAGLGLDIAGGSEQQMLPSRDGKPQALPWSLQLLTWARGAPQGARQLSSLPRGADSQDSPWGCACVSCWAVHSPNNSYSVPARGRRVSVLSAGPTGPWPWEGPDPEPEPQQCRLPGPRLVGSRG